MFPILMNCSLSPISSWLSDFAFMAQVYNMKTLSESYVSYSVSNLSSRNVDSLFKVYLKSDYFSFIPNFHEGGSTLTGYPLWTLAHWHNVVFHVMGIIDQTWYMIERLASEGIWDLKVWHIVVLSQNASLSSQRQDL